MNPLLRASVIAALTLACIESRAEVHRSCIRSLGVQSGAESPKPTLSPKKTCVTAIAFAAQPQQPELRATARPMFRSTSTRV